MPPKGKGGGGGSKGDKKQQLWNGIRIQKLDQVRWALANAGVLPASRNEEGLTTFLLAASLGVDKSLAEMVRWYERRDRELRMCLELPTEDSEQSPLHVACALGHHACVKILLDACGSLDRDNSYAKRQLSRKDASGKTPRELAASGKHGEKERAVLVIDDFLHESSEEEDDDEGGAEDTGLTSTQLSKLKKLALIEKETGVSASSSAGSGGGGPGSSDGAAKAEPEVERGELPQEMPTPRWPEVASWAASVKLLRPVCELTVDRRGDDAPAAQRAGGAEETAQPAPPPPPPGGGAAAASSDDVASGDDEVVDPALWYCHTLNRLQLRLAPGVLSSLRPDGVSRLSALTTLIVSNNSLTSLPDTIGGLPLKNLDASNNAIECLPASMPSKTLELVDVSGNRLSSLDALEECSNLVTLSVDDNCLESLEGLPFADLSRLVTLSACSNNIAAIPQDVGLLAKLETLALNDNSFTEVPASLSACKKLKVLKIDGCPVKDNKIKKYLAQTTDGMKQLSKYLEKNGAGAGGGGGKKGGGKKKK